MKKKRILFIVILSMLLAFTACGGKENPETDSGDGWLAKLNELAVKTVMEKSDYKSMIEDGNLEIVIDKIHPGSFTQKDANEIFLDCWFKGMPAVGGLDSRAGILLDADTWEVTAYKEFEGGAVMLCFPQTAKGQSLVLYLDGGARQGTWAQTIGLWSVNDGEWEILPTGIEDFLPEGKAESVLWGADQAALLRIQDCCCYMYETCDTLHSSAGHGGRLAVVWTYGDAEAATPLSELFMVLVWDPSRERFVLDQTTMQLQLKKE